MIVVAGHVIASPMHATEAYVEALQKVEDLARSLLTSGPPIHGFVGEFAERWFKLNTAVGHAELLRQEGRKQ